MKKFKFQDSDYLWILFLWILLFLVLFCVRIAFAEEVNERQLTNVQFIIHLSELKGDIEETLSETQELLLEIDKLNIKVKESEEESEEEDK